MINYRKGLTIGDLSGNLKLLAALRCAGSPSNEIPLKEAFVWENSEEGHDYWEAVSRGEITTIPKEAEYLFQ